MKRFQQFLIVGPSAFMIGTLAAFVATLGLMGVMQAQPQNISTMYGCQTATSQTCTTLQPVAVDSSGNVKATVTGTISPTNVYADLLCFDVANKDTCLQRDAANTLALRNGTNGQLFNAYNTFASSTSYERLEVGANAGGVGANTFGIVATKGSGGGSNRSLYIFAGVDTFLGSNGVFSTGYKVSSGHFLAQTDNTYDIGASGANRPRTVYAATSVQAGNTVLGSLTHAASGVRFLCIDTNGVIATQSTACVGT